MPRTIFDLAASHPDSVEPALRQAEYLRLYDSLSLLDLLDFEDRFIAFLNRHDLPRPHFNAWLTIGADRFQVDCLWPVPRQIVELDSWSAHGTRTAFRSDRSRDRKLAVAGYTTTRIPWAALDDEPAEIAADLRRLLRESKP